VAEERNHFDETSAWFAKSDPVDVLGWAFRVPTLSYVFRGWLDTKTIPFGAPDRRCDTVAYLERVDPPGEPWAVTIEFQTEPDPLMFGRLLEYAARVWQVEKPSPGRGDRFALGAVVINLTGVGRATRGYEWPDLGLGLGLRVVERNLARESAADTLAEIAAGTVSRSILPLIPLMAGAGGPGIIEEWKRLGLTEPNQRRRGELGEMALVYVEATDHSGLWKAALKEWNVRQSKQVLEWQAEGRAEALVDTRVDDVLAILQARFAPVPAEIASTVRATRDPLRLGEWVIQAATAESLDQFRAATGL
jgi:hypothetical protein